MDASLLKSPQWTTGSRLLKLGEEIRFSFYLPENAQAGLLEIFPRYLERARPGASFVAGGDMNWLDALKPVRLALKFRNGRADLRYRPRQPGSYLARWRAGGETLYRYFAAIEDDWIVLSFSTHSHLETEPTLHATGIPLDYRLPIDKFDADDPLFQKFLGYHRFFGDPIIPFFPDTPRLTVEERVAEYGKELGKARALLPDSNDTRSARLELYHIENGLDPGYTETLMRLGVNNHCGLMEANAKPWLGMPEFPYYSSPVDCRKINQGEGGAVVAHQWDFCGGWHFLGPVTWHYGVSGDNWDEAVKCLREGMNEARNLTEMSGHPAFLYPLYEGDVPHYNYPRSPYDGFLDDIAAMKRFAARYQYLTAFEFPKKYRMAYARSLDIADYYRRHYKVTPRTVFVSTTDHILYDMWWLCHWNNHKELLTKERIPWLTLVSPLMRFRQATDRLAYFKDPLSYEYILVEDRQRQMRFERECPNPIWWFDYTRQEKGPGGSAISHTVTPDVEVMRSGWMREGSRITLKLKMLTRAEFPDYAIAVWGLPVKKLLPSMVKTDAKEFILAKNTAGEHHIVLQFDLKPDREIYLSLEDVER